MDPPTSFVFPPADSLLCPLHHGVLSSPVTAPCGCTYCLSCIVSSLTQLPGQCPIENAPLSISQLTANTPLAERVDELLIHCRWGIEKKANGSEWTVNPDGCPLWLTFGNRETHESKCPYMKSPMKKVLSDDDFVFVEETPEESPRSSVKQPSPAVSPSTSPVSAKSVPAPSTSAVSPKRVESAPSVEYRCIHDSCVFVAKSEEEIATHLRESCEFELLVRRIDELVSILGEKDEEILRLSEQLQALRQSSASSSYNSEERRGEEKDAVAEFAEAVRQVGQEVLGTIAREGDQLLSDAKSNLMQARDKVQVHGSHALQSSLQTLANLKLVIATMSRKAQREVASKLDRLSHAASQLPREISEEFKALRQALQNSVSNQNQNQNQNEPAEGLSDVVVEGEPAASPESVPAAPAPAQEEVELDEDMKQALALSKESFELDQQKTQTEEESMRIAILQSIEAATSE